VVEAEREIQAKVIIAPKALEQLDQLSSRLIERVLDRLDLLAIFPWSGAQVPQDGRLLPPVLEQLERSREA